jgi:hypothetical protein
VEVGLIFDFSVRGKTADVSTAIHWGFFPVLKIEERPSIRFRSREGFCLASFVYYAVRTVKAFLKTSKVQIIFLPPYSLNLNLIERLWRFLKKLSYTIGTMSGLLISRERFWSFLRTSNSIAWELKSLMTLNFHTLGT